MVWMSEVKWVFLQQFKWEYLCNYLFTCIQQGIGRGLSKWRIQEKESYGPKILLYIDNNLKRLGLRYTHLSCKAHENIEIWYYLCYMVQPEGQKNIHLFKRNGSTVHMNTKINVLNYIVDHLLYSSPSILMNLWHTLLFKIWRPFTFHCIW